MRVKGYTFALALSLGTDLLFLNMMQLDEMLEKRGVKVDKVLNFAIDDTILEERITGRWVHPASGRSYHTKFAPPKAPGVDDVRLKFIHLWFCEVPISNMFYYCFQY